MTGEPINLTDLTLFEASQRIADREISPVELTQVFLEHIEAVDPKVNSFITVTPELALESAHQAEEEILNSGPRSPLHGIPLALKDLYETGGVRTTAGSKFFADWTPGEDAETVQRLKSAGAVLLGKLNMHEIALGLTTVNPHYGPCRNPWALDCVVGGSSGGSAAALAARMCLGSLGSDTGGSIRVPAALCSVVGLKPTYGRVSLRGTVPLSWNMDHAGPMARTVRDAALLLQAIAGYDPLDPQSLNMPVDDYTTALEAGVGGWRFALAAGDYFSFSEAEVLAAVQAAADVFASLGAQVAEVDFPDARLAAQANVLMVLSDAAAFHRERLEERPQDFGADILQRLRTGAAYTAVDYSLARRTQALLRRQFERFFEDYDILLMPTTPVPAPPIEGPDAVEQARLLTRFTAPFNITGLPAISVPCGFTTAGLPIGLQLITRPWAEAALLRAAFAYEQATEWHLRRPVL
jgi:aspartyl-tRNA(Asn)/glutamyl-tRNA(Gln) amidotransferase subunit A